MNKKNAVKMWVAPSFRQALKKLAIEEDTSVINLTRNMSRDPDPFISIMGERKRDKDFKIF